MTVLIDAIEPFIVDLPTIRPHRLSMTTMAYQTMVIVRVRCSDGLEGIGEATTIGGLSYGAESPEAIHSAIENYLAPLLVGQPADNPNRLRSRMQRYVRANSFAKSALETALLDAQGQRLGVPVSSLLGGAQNERLAVLWTLASGNAVTDIAEAERLLADDRHRQFKLKIGGREVRDDVEHVISIQQGLPDGVSLRVDVNQAWSESQAKPAIAVLQNAGIDLIEQPTPGRQMHALTRLSQRFEIALMADEAVADTFDGMRLWRSGFSGAIALKIAKAGGPIGALELAHAVEAVGLDLYGGTMLEGTIGTAAAVHAWSTLRECRWGTEMFGPLLLTEDIVTESLHYCAGGVTVPDAPGLGVSIDEDKLDYFRRDGGPRRTTSIGSELKGRRHAV
ncbi:muconate cycloisomerase family protein [Salinisphaera orenii]|nr:muconate cycloisomerase family protein [Salinisphaera halophila]